MLVTADNWCPFVLGCAALLRSGCVERGSPLVFVEFILCIRQVNPAAFLKVSAPESALSGSARSLAGRPFAKDDPPLGQVVWRHFDVHTISND